jgi:hypothetical protein
MNVVPLKALSLVILLFLGVYVPTFLIIGLITSTLAISTLLCSPDSDNRELMFSFYPEFPPQQEQK